MSANEADLKGARRTVLDDARYAGQTAYRCREHFSKKLARLSEAEREFIEKMIDQLDPRS
jgi:hypothetical protein